ncbi:diguanylate cyclase/phosphodiesterase (GGDEF & EAL domains) with PAS/PAC sensor(s) [hydrothermal vent metagenome]|uniref:Diguanylate cyclase/phosphodiesterase (GGDEF & EAL domains) with PAS/PAC sensor(S) n=1 Tax=hydrothermal vent metagenome TaxID=652676 RepID=A0A3B1AFN9_9ZZZZ
MDKSKLIVIDDEVDLAGFVADVAQQQNFDIEEFYSGRDFMNDYSKQADVIVLDIMMPDVDGIQLIRFLAGIDCNAQIILISGFDSSVLHSALKLAEEQGLNIVGCLNKPFRYDDLKELFNKLVITPKVVTENELITSVTVEELEQAIFADELVTYYQPQIMLQGESYLAVEALVRWQHPVFGLIGPKNFIPMAEEYDLINDLTWVVLNQVMTQCVLWHQQDIDVQVAINMSAKTLQDLRLPEKLGDLVLQYNLKTSQIVLEVTETALMQELIKSLEILTRLRLKGFKLSIDDFGTGYSSLVQLNRIPFSELKIDQSFVMNMENEREALAIVETVIVLGNKLGMKIVAEGVETEASLDILKKLGCNIGQGFLISRPLASDDITAWLKNNKK